MSINVASTVRDLAVNIPGATAVFENLGIDYCCGGGRTLADACVNANVPIEKVTLSLEKANESASEVAPLRDWQTGSMAELITWLVEKHHVYTREALSRITRLMAKVCDVHGGTHPELLDLKGVFQNLKDDLDPHLLKEEQVLFPYIGQLEAASTGKGSLPRAFFGTVRNPVRMMSVEHEAVGDLLKQLRTISSNYTIPPEACISYETLFKAMVEFEEDLHQHIHLENNILFPRAVKVEEEVANS